MKEILICAHNRVVHQDDTTYMLGDISLREKPKTIYEVLARLKGQLVIIKGNHDSSKFIKYLRKNNYILPDGCIFRLNGVDDPLTTECYFHPFQRVASALSA